MSGLIVLMLVLCGIMAMGDALECAFGAWLPITIWVVVVFVVVVLSNV